ncbi:MAG: hypothetical protein WBS24_05900 [Terriglobales bacterium]
MTLLGELLRDTPWLGAEKHSAAAGVERVGASVRPLTIREQQIRSLVQQLFFPRESAPVRRIGFTPVESSPATARLSLDVAKALVEEGNYDVALIDACIGETPLFSRLQIPAPSGAQAPWMIAPKLWLAPCESWCSTRSRPVATDEHLGRLRELMAEFDFSIVHCPPVPWLTARAGDCCDGLVLVLTANRTRRLAAAQVKQQLSQTGIPLLGTVLAERRFPVPDGLYRSL